MALFWLSFVDPDISVGEQFLGVTVVEGADPMSAIKTAWKLGINPGGAVVVVEIPPEKTYLAIQYQNRLVLKNELNNNGEFSGYDRKRHN